MRVPKLRLHFSECERFWAGRKEKKKGRQRKHAREEVLRGPVLTIFRDYKCLLAPFHELPTFSARYLTPAPPCLNHSLWWGMEMVLCSSEFQRALQPLTTVSASTALR
jgi:hypothetical protein